ncbi:MAG: alpha/beta hydrolase [Acidobacteria bacterium 13_2_20CM_2_57_6]|nr:MAG: alpha/beta hydrolase [Acidobacteria bacterium 13_2_20CM_2_57_6]
MLRLLCVEFLLLGGLLSGQSLSAQNNNEEHRVRNVVLVHGAWADGSGYGGAVITEAGTDPAVAGLVYIAAHMPDAGENEADDGKRFPSDLSKSTGIKKTADGFTYLDPAQFHEYFAADLSAEQAAFMARSQVMNKADNFKAVITTPAWRNKPSWMLVAGADRTINPDLERWYATRANSHKVEVSGASHSVYVSRPKEVAAVIEEAASQVR